MKKICLKIEWDVDGLEPSKMLEGIRWYLNPLKGNHSVTEIQFPTDEDLIKEIEARFKDEYVQQEVLKLFGRYKRQSLGELMGRIVNIKK